MMDCNETGHAVEIRVSGTPGRFITKCTRCGETLLVAASAVGTRPAAIAETGS